MKKKKKKKRKEEKVYEIKLGQPISSYYRDEELPALSRIWRRSTLSLRFRAAWKYPCWLRMDSEQVPCFSHSCDQNKEPLPLGQASVGQLTRILLIRSEIYRMNDIQLTLLVIEFKYLCCWCSINYIYYQVSLQVSYSKIDNNFNIFSPMCVFVSQKKKNFNIFLIKHWYLRLNIRAVTC